MPRNVLCIAIALLTAALALGAVACDGGGDEDSVPPTDTPAAELPTEPLVPTEPEPEPDEEETAVPTEPEGQITVIMLEVEGSGVAGTAILTPSNGSTLVDVDVAVGLEPGSHASHIHTGTCDAQGPVEEPLTNVEADGAGAGKANSTVERPLSDLTDGNHYVAVHALDGDVVTCGDIPPS